MKPIDLPGNPTHEVEVRARLREQGFKPVPGDPFAFTNGTDFVFINPPWGR